MIPGYEIRLARHEELARLPDIERSAASLFASQASELGLSPAQLATVNTVEALDRANRDGRLWVAVDAHGAPVGLALVKDLGLFAHLDELDVVPGHARQGIGSALLEVVCAWAFTRGFSAVTLSTFRDVPWNAPFYARRGFAIIEPSELPPELIQIIELESRKGLRADLRVIMQREV